jgi:hypothetical protein
MHLLLCTDSAFTLCLPPAPFVLLPAGPHPPRGPPVLAPSSPPRVEHAARQPAAASTRSAAPSGGGAAPPLTTVLLPVAARRCMAGVHEGSLSHWEGQQLEVKFASLTLRSSAQHYTL